VATTVARALALAADRLGATAALARVAGAPVDEVDLTATRAELAAVRPRHWRRIHPTWIEHALAGEGEAVRRIVTGDGDGPVDRLLARWFLGGFVAMPAHATGAAALAVLEPAALTQALLTIGRRQLAHALAGSPPREVAGLAARLPWGRALVADVAAVTALGDAATDLLGPRRAALARTAGLTWTDPLALPRTGLRAIAPVCAALGDLPRQLAQRLPRPVGLVAETELRGPFARDRGVGVAEIVAAIARAPAAP
jgi:hypothetical protein